MVFYNSRSEYVKIIHKFLNNKKILHVYLEDKLVLNPIFDQ